MAPKIAIVIYSATGHIRKLAEAEKEGIESAGGQATLLKIEETQEHGKTTINSDLPTATAKGLQEFDAFLFGIPTRYGNMPAQWKAFWDGTGGQWYGGGYIGKYVGAFVSTSSLGGGQESTFISSLSTFAHHGLIYVPLGYFHAMGIMSDLSEVRGGSPWGAGAFTRPKKDGEEVKITAKELELAKIQGAKFYETVAKVKF